MIFLLQKRGHNTRPFHMCTNTETSFLCLKESKQRSVMNIFLCLGIREEDTHHFLSGALRNTQDVATMTRRPTTANTNIHKPQLTYTRHSSCEKFISLKTNTGSKQFTTKHDSVLIDYIQLICVSLVHEFYNKNTIKFKVMFSLIIKATLRRVCSSHKNSFD